MLNFWKFEVSRSLAIELEKKNTYQPDSFQSTSSNAVEKETEYLSALQEDDRLSDSSLPFLSFEYVNKKGFH